MGPARSACTALGSDYLAPVQDVNELSPEVIHNVFHRVTHSIPEQRPLAQESKSTIPSCSASKKMSKEESVPPTNIGISDVLYSAQPKNRPVEGICAQFLSMVTMNTAVSRETLMRPVRGPTNIQSVVAGVKQKMNRGRAIRCGVVHTVIHSDIHRPMHRLPSFPPRRQRSSWNMPRDFRCPLGEETRRTYRHDLWQAADRLARECLRTAPPRTE